MAKAIPVTSVFVAHRIFFRRTRCISNVRGPRLCRYILCWICFSQVVEARGVAPLVADSFRSLCGVLGMLQFANEGLVSPGELRHAIRSHLERYQRAYEYLSWTYKFHASLHLWLQLLKCGILIALFTLERRHKIIKRYVHADRRNTKSFERGLIEEVTLQHLFDMRTKWWKGSLEATRAPSTAVHDALVNAVIGDVARVQVASQGHLPSGHSVHVGDVVAVELDGKHVVGELWLLATLTSADGTESDVACLSIWPRTGGTQRCRDFAIDDKSPTYVPLYAVRSSLIYCMNAQKTLASCIIPLPLRSCRFA
jgi:hypothetical protein